MATMTRISRAAFNIRQAAELTGFHRNTISQAIRNGTLPAKAYGNRRVVILGSDIDRWLVDLPTYPKNHNQRVRTKLQQS
jgi:excisionase family DNA binding protein